MKVHLACLFSLGVSLANQCSTGLVEKKALCMAVSRSFAVHLLMADSRLILELAF
jgi:hypothetical protein